MAFVESDRVQIRMYMGYSALWLQADPRLESAITNVQAVSDGGTRPDTSTEVAIKGVIAKLQTIDTQREQLIPIMFAVESDETKADPVRADAALCRVARTYVHRLARFLDTEPRSDIYAPGKPQPAYPSAPFGGNQGY